ncbi:MAG: ATP synthase F0 subunit C [Candidatus Margulisbacteria bacterium]|nr:ATP synthase F0 subunit C [Candidatus Margulisiibacteriota bacterium]MBU1022239.1 ATP synthase F0 subunit C [Candidatus Margulisiibacteriota bacterium]MBU1729322.1 ATP synthase F0 subunit C [Candidatus Margulisiibacteriota bacterium]MBU1955595.1 ATP synthase F0 subunit C [Candidatus Margulisiibacteriota bacterium]
MSGLTLAIAAFGCALGIGFLAGKGLEAMGRQPEASGSIRTAMLVAIAFIEAIALYALVIEILILYK